MKREAFAKESLDTSTAMTQSVPDNPISAQSNLTQTQFLIWMGQQMNPDVPLYNMIQTFTFEEALQVEAFQCAFQKLVDQSDALRSIIVEEAGVPQQRVQSSFVYRVEYVDFADHANPQESYQQWLERRRLRLFDLSSCLFDSVLLRLAANRFVWYLSHHHLITDGWSFIVAYKRMAELYARALTHDQSNLPSLPSYRDYAAFEQNFRRSAAFQTAEQYWRAKIATPVEPLEFFGKPASTRDARSERVACQLGAERSARLRALAGEPGLRMLSADLSLYSIFATLLCAYLHRVSGNQRLRIGVPFHNRPTAAFKETLGIFIEIGPLAFAVAESDNFATLHKKVANELLTSLRYAQPGISSAERNRAYEVLLNYVNVSFPPFAGMTPTIDWVHTGYGDRDHSLRLQVHDFGASGNFTLHFDFNCSVFTPQQREWSIQHFLRIVDAFIADRQCAINAICLQSEAEYQSLVVDFNRSAAAYPSEQTMVDLFEAQVARTPDAIAIEMEGQRLTYHALNARANQLAHHLMQMGVGPEQLVLLYMQHSLEVVIAIWAILKAGGAYVPVDPNYPRERLTFMLADIAQSMDGAQPILITQPHLQPVVAATNARIIAFDATQQTPSSTSDANPTRRATPQNLAYVIYTSGSTGKPKGVMIEHRSLMNYIWWAKAQYTQGERLTFPLFSSLAFDLTITSIFVPLISGGRIVVYREDEGVRGMVILKVIEDKQADIIKLTPAHLAMIQDLPLRETRIRKFIVGGEDFKTALARTITHAFAQPIEIYNEYGPTEATVGCMIHRFDIDTDRELSVPIGIPAANAQIYILDKHHNPTPSGVIGEMFLAGDGLARGYFNRLELSNERFIANPFVPGQRMYRTGDLARWLPSGRMEFLGRADHQIKVGGARIELGEIEARMLAHPAVQECSVIVIPPKPADPSQTSTHCARCGLASNFPNVHYDEAGVCNFCRAFDGYKDKAQAYFKRMDELRMLSEQMKAQRNGLHDCIVLFSGGKDSTYMLYQLVGMGLKPLVFTLDNGFLSDQAKANIRRIVQSLGVDHIFGITPAMNAIFVDSLKQYANVCNGCFKTIYTLAVNLAREKGIRYIVTGLSRGQFFETRLTPELFKRKDFDPQKIDDAILAARKAYHQRDDVISRSLAVDVFRDEALFEHIQFVDFYRYCDVSLDELYAFLNAHAPWIRPSDTGRSTNCLINDVGIYIHKKQRGFHNYALPYSWDVRMGHKTREAANAELDDDIDEAHVKRIMSEIGYVEPTQTHDHAAHRLAAYYVSTQPLTASELRAHLGQQLPEYMLPSYFIRLPQLPLTTNGKVDRKALPRPGEERPDLGADFIEPRTPTEARLAEIWRETLNLSRIGVHDNFFDLGGSSLPAIQIIARIGQTFQVDVPMPTFFQKPTIAALSQTIEDLLIDALEEMSEEEAERLLKMP